LAGLTFDSGALIAAERGDREFWAFWAAVVDIDKSVPAVALAQVWRGPRNARLARVLAACEVEPLGDELARKTGELCGRAGTSDIVDAAVVAGAARRGDDIVTGDAGDIRRLASEAPGVGRILDLARLRR
jgi:predicted nucleic acid-binding protein